MVGDPGQRLFDHLLGIRIVFLLFADAPFARLTDAQPLQRSVGVGCELVLVMGIDRIGIARVLEDLNAIDAAPDGAGGTKPTALFWYGVRRLLRSKALFLKHMR